MKVRKKSVSDPLLACDKRAVTIVDLARDGIYKRFEDRERVDGVKLRKALRMFVEGGIAIAEGAVSQRAIAKSLLNRIEELPPDANSSVNSLMRACTELRSLLGIEVLERSRSGKFQCRFTTEGRMLWEEAVVWKELGRLEDDKIIDISLLSQLAQRRNSGCGGEDVDCIRREAG